MLVHFNLIRTFESFSDAYTLVNVHVYHVKGKNEYCIGNLG